MGVIKSRKSTKDSHYNDQKKENEKANNDLQNTTKKTRGIAQHETH